MPVLSRGDGCQPRTLPALFKAGRNALVGRAHRRFRYRTGDVETADDFLLGADPAQPFFVAGGRKALAGGKTRAGVDDAKAGGLLGRIGRAARRTRSEEHTSEL